VRGLFFEPSLPFRVVICFKRVHLPKEAGLSGIILQKQFYVCLQRIAALPRGEWNEAGLTADALLQVLAIDAGGFPLKTLQAALRTAEYPASLGVGIAGAATEAELESTDWDAVILRWNTPELHEIALIERDLRKDSPDAEAVIANHLQIASNSDDPGGQLIVSDHLRKTNAIYSLQILPALIAEEDHAGWAAMDVVLRCIAAETEGLIWVPDEGYCDSDGELLLAEEYADEDLEEE
jgi:hypothetical protein